MGTGQKRALHIAAHGDDHIHFRNIGQQFAVLRSFHINTVDLLHQPDGIRVNTGFGFRTGRVAFKHVACQFLAKASAIWLR